MNVRHKVRINVEDKNGDKQMILESEILSLPKKLLTWIFGDFCEVLVLTPGETVQGIEIFEQRGEGHDRSR